MSEQTRVLELLFRWEELNDGGQEVTPEELCRNEPGLLGPVREGIERLRRMARRLESQSLASMRLVSTPSIASQDTNGDRPTGATGSFSSASLPKDSGLRDVEIAGYEILGELGRGGMGVVYKARQTSINRIVALKMVRSGDHASEHELARFRSEAEAVAGLSHPHVVQLFEYGTQEGSPYFTLEFMEGGSLGKQIKDRPLEFREAAAMVERLAQGVAAAHARNIIHRDLKPDNVLLTADGSPKIADFGLAKQVVVEGEGMTQSGAVVGTPSYMSPEQARGEKTIGPATDIWALGAILYRLFTGRPPFLAATTFDTLQQIVEAEPVPPRSLIPALPRDLETICLKCLRKEPARRYGSAQELANDLQRYLEGKPIMARPVGALERGVKWARRRPAAAAALALLCCLFVALGTGLFLVNSERIKTRRERDDKEIALQEKVVALHQEQAAVRQTYKSFGLLTDEVVANLLGKQTALSPEDRVFLKNVLEYWEQFAEVRGDSIESRELAAEGNMRIGMVRYRLGELKLAEANFRKAVAIREELVGANVEPLHHQTLAQSLSDFGVFLFENGKITEAEPVMRRAVALREKLAAESNSLSTDRAHLATSRSNLALLLKETGRLDESLAMVKLAIGERLKLAAEEPNSVEHAEQLTHSHINYASLLTETGRDADAENEYSSALEIQERLTAKHPDLTQVRLEQARSHYGLGNRHKDAGRLAKAKESFAAALAIQLKLVAQYPARPSYQDELALTMLNMGSLHADLGETAEAEAALRKSIALLEQIFAANPEVTNYRRDLAAANHQYGNILFEAGQSELAGKQFEIAVEHMRKLATDLPNTPEYRLDLAKSLKSQCRVLQLRGAPEAEKIAQEAASIQIELAKEHPNRLDFQVESFKEQRELAQILLALGKTKEAVAAFKQTMRGLEALRKSFPDRVAIEGELVETYTKTAKAYSLANSHQEAVKLLASAIEFGEQLTGDRSVRPVESRRLAVAYWESAVLYRETGDPEKALALCRTAEKLMEKLCEEDPKNVRFRDDLAGMRSDAGGLLLEANKLDEATKELLSSLQIRNKLVATYPARLEFRGHTARTESNLAIALARSKKPEEAATHFKRAIELKTPEAEAFSNQPHHQQELAQFLSNYGTLLKDLNKPAEAEATQRKALAIHESLVKMEPNRIDYQFSLAGSEVNFGLMLVGAEKSKEALPWFERAVERLSEIRKQLPKHPVVMQFLANGLGAKAGALEKLSRYKDEVIAWRAALEVVAQPRRKEFRTQLARALALSGETEQALPIAEELLRGEPTADDCYNAACIFALSAKTVADVPAAAMKHQERALALLKDAESKGRFATEEARTEMAKDNDLDSIRGRPEFQDWWKKLNESKKSGSAKAKQ